MGYLIYSFEQSYPVYQNRLKLPYLKNLLRRKLSSVKEKSKIKKSFSATLPSNTGKPRKYGRVLN